MSSVPAGDLLHPTHRARRTRQQSGQVPGSVANDGQRFLGERGENQLTFFTVRQHFARDRIDDLRVEVVFPDMQPVFCFHTFHCHTRGP